MKTVALALLALLPLAQDEDPYDAKVREIASRLTAEELEARDDAQRDLVRLGPPAVPALKRAAAASDSPDIRAALEAAVSEIERLDRMKEYLGTETRVTISAKDRPMEEVIDALKKQVSTGITASSSVRSEKITIELQDVPLFEAVDRICRTHGGITARLPRTGGESVAFRTGDPSKRHRTVLGRIAVELESAVLEEDSDYGGTVRQTMTLQFRSAWEKGTKPIGAKLELTVLVDGTGASLVGSVQKDRNGFYRTREAPTQFTVTLDRLPGEGADGFREIGGVLELDFPRDIEVLRVESPLGKTDVPLAGRALSFTMRECTRSGKQIKLVVQSAADTDLWNRDLKLVDTKGKAYQGFASSASGDGQTMTYTMSFTVPETTEIAEMRLVEPEPGRVEKVPFTFKNVRVR